MKDERGVYYYPIPQNKRVKMYVQDRDETVYFRLWNADDPQLWAQHGWIPYEAIKRAEAMYQRKNAFNPKQAYDLEIARTVLNE